MEDYFPIFDWCQRGQESIRLNKIVCSTIELSALRSGQMDSRMKEEKGLSFLLLALLIREMEAASLEHCLWKIRRL